MNGKGPKRRFLTLINLEGREDCAHRKPIGRYQVLRGWLDRLISKSEGKRNQSEWSEWTNERLSIWESEQRKKEGKVATAGRWRREKIRQNCQNCQLACYLSARGVTRPSSFVYVVVWTHCGLLTNSCKFHCKIVNNRTLLAAFESVTTAYEQCQHELRYDYAHWDLHSLFSLSMQPADGW